MERSKDRTTCPPELEHDRLVLDNKKLLKAITTFLRLAKERHPELQ